ncbi:MAG: glycosyltransferase [Verrucomicrobiota bacterium]
MDCVLAIPCYKESERLPPFLDELAQQVSQSPFSIHLQLVDDGSGEEEKRMLIRHAQHIGKKHKLAISTHIIANNRGKGFAVRHAWRNAPDATLLAFVDADGAVPPNEALAVLKHALDTPNELTIASRYIKGSKIKRKRSRMLFSIGFRALFGLIYRIDCSDTQCGLKFVPTDFYRANESDFRQNRWGLDVELILKAADNNIPIREIGIQWREKKGSKVNIGYVWPLIRDMILDRI